VSATISSYIYNAIVYAQISDEDPTLKTRNRVMYTNPVVVYQGVDNLVTVLIRNSDQKPANVDGMQLTLSITGDPGNVAIQNYPVTISNATSSIGTVVLDQANVANLTQEWYYYTISYTSPIYANLTLPAFVDANFGAAGKMQIRSNLYG